MLQLRNERQPVGVPQLLPEHQDGFLALAANYPQDVRADSSGFSERGPIGWGNGVVGAFNLHSYFLGDAPGPVAVEDGEGLLFNGSSNFLTTYGVVGGFPGSADQTLLAVVRFASSSGTQNLLGFYSDAFGPEEYGRGLYLTGGVIKASGVSASSGKILNSGVTPVLGRRYVIAARFSTKGALAVNGRIMATGDIGDAWPYNLSVGCGITEYPAGPFGLFNGTMQFAYGRDGGWSDGELEAYTDNPWQLFRAPSASRWFFSLTPPPTLAYTYPVADITTAGWLNETSGLPLYPSLADGGAGTPNDATYAKSPDNPTTEEFEVLLTARGAPVGGLTTYHSLNYHLQALGLDTIFTLKLVCGSTVLDTWTETVTVAAGVVNRSHAISSGVAATITDYTNVRIRGTAHV